MLGSLMRRLLGAMVMLWVLVPAQARDPNGPAFLVNTTTAGDQGASSANGPGIVTPVAVAARADGGFVVVWNQRAQNQVGSPSVAGGVYAQRYDVIGARQGGEFQVFAGETRALDVATAPDGAFVVVGFDPVSSHVRAQRFTSTGDAAGAAIAVSDGPFGPGPVCSRSNYSNPQVAMQADGAFVVVWACATTDPTFVAAGTYARYYDGDGFALSGIVPLGNFTTPGTGFISGLTPDVIMTDGGYMVVYESPCRAAPRDENNNLWSAPCAQQFNANGEAQGDYVPLGPQLTFGTFAATRPQVARDSAGNFAVVWLRRQPDEQGVERVSVAHGSYTPAGALIAGDAFVVDPALQGIPRIAMASSAGTSSFVLTYATDGWIDPEQREEVQFAEYQLDGTFGAAGAAHLDHSARHLLPAAAMDGNGNYVLAWSRVDETGASDVYARRFGGTPGGGQLRFVAPPVTNTGPFPVVGEFPESHGTFTVGVERINGSAGVALAEIEITGAGNQLGPDDITPAPYSALLPLRWEDGEMGVKSLSFTIAQDSLDEDTELGRLGFASVGGATIDGPLRVTIVVLDDDREPNVLVDFLDAIAREEAQQPLSIPLRLSAPSGKDISIAYRLSGTAQLGVDYTVSPASPVSIPAGQTEATITLTPADDSAEEPEESILVDLDLAGSVNVAAGADTQARVTIAANDGALAADLFALIEGSSESMPVGSRRTLSLTVSNFGPDASPVVTSQLRLDKGRIAVFPLGPSAAVSCERSNLDRTLSCDVPGGLAPNAQRSYTVEIEAPAAIEADTETLTATHLVLGSVPDPIPSNNDAIRRLTVRPLRRGVVGFTSAEFATTEPADAQDAAVQSILVSVQLNGSEGAASVGYAVVAGGTAAENADYTVLGSGRLQFEGDGTQFFSLQIAHDTLPEDLESFALRLVDPLNADIDPAMGVKTFVINDNDEGPGDRRPDPFALTNAAGQNRQEGVAPGVAVELSPITIRGLGGDAALTLAVEAGADRAKAAGAGSAEYSINGAAFTSSNGVVRNGDVVRVRAYAANTPGAATDVVLGIGGVSARFTIVTQSSTPVDISTDGGGSLGGLSLLLALPALWRGRRALRMRRRVQPTLR